MVQKIKDNSKEIKLNTAYCLLYFFVGSLLIKVVFGAFSGATSLLASSILPLFGVFIAIVTIIRINGSSNEKIAFSYEKLEFIIIAGVSLIIAIATVSILFLVVHLIFFHTLFPPGLFGAWISAIICIANFYMLSWVNEKSHLLEEVDNKQINFLINNDLLFSIIVVFSIVLARSGFIIIDYLVAILGGIYILWYSIHFLSHSFKGLMDASCDLPTLSKITNFIKSADPTMHIKDIRIRRVGKAFEIISIISLPKETKIKKAQAIIYNIKNILGSKIPEPCEVHIGFESK